MKCQHIVLLVTLALSQFACSNTTQRKDWPDNPIRVLVLAHEEEGWCRIVLGDELVTRAHRAYFENNNFTCQGEGPGARVKTSVGVIFRPSSNTFITPEIPAAQRIPAIYPIITTTGTKTRYVEDVLADVAYFGGESGTSLTCGTIAIRFDELTLISNIGFDKKMVAVVGSGIRHCRM